MADCLRILGTHASANDRFTVLTMVGRRVLIQAFIALPGNGSNMHDLAQALTRRVDSSFTDVGQRECSSFTAGHTTCSLSGLKSGELRPFLIVSIFCKKSANFFASSTALSYWSNFPGALRFNILSTALNRVTWLDLFSSTTEEKKVILDS